MSPELIFIELLDTETLNERESRVTYMFRDGIHFGDDLHHGIINPLRHNAGVLTSLYSSEMTLALDCMDGYF